MAIRVITDLAGEILMAGLGTRRDKAIVEQREDVTIRGFGTATRTIQGGVMSRYTATSRETGAIYVINGTRAIDLSMPQAPVGTMGWPTGTMTVTQTDVGVNGWRRTMTVIINYVGKPAPEVTITDVSQPPPPPT